MQSVKWPCLALLVSLVAAPASAAPMTPPSVRVPKILFEVSRDLGIPHGAAGSQARTVLAIAKAIALLDSADGHQSRKFAVACLQVVRDVNAGGLAPGSLWRHFAVGRLVSGADLPEQMLPGDKDAGRTTFSAAEYSALLVWMSPTLSRLSLGTPKLEQACGKALIVMDMESLLINFWVCGVAHYRGRWLQAPAQAAYLASAPEAAVISQNRQLRLALRSYYRRAISLNYYGMEPLTKPFQRLIQQHDRSVAGLRKILPTLSRLRKFALPEQYFVQWQVAHLSWQLLNFYRSDTQGGALSVLRGYVEQWRRTTRRPLLRWWLGQALRTRGIAPRSVWSPPILVCLATPHG